MRQIESTTQPRQAKLEKKQVKYYEANAKEKLLILTQHVETKPCFKSLA